MASAILRDVLGSVGRAAVTRPDLATDWDRLCREAVRAGRVPELHAARGDVQALFHAHLQILDGCLTVADRLGGPPAEADRLAAVRADIQRLHDGLFPRWQSEDDLDDILVDLLSIPNERLIALAQGSPPPVWWWADDDDPSRATADNSRLWS